MVVNHNYHLLANHNSIVFTTNLQLIFINITTHLGCNSKYSNFTYTRKEALLYSIPKMMEWKHMLTKTKPITLLETLRKTLVKIITKRLLNVIAEKNILKGGNHAALPRGSTKAPLRIINTCIKDAKSNKKPIWMMFQNLSKAYDRVDVEMLKLVMIRIKVPNLLIQLITNLFVNSKKAIIGYFGITSYLTLQIGIDQGEVISPLL
jgi:hypothetical protein